MLLIRIKKAVCHCYLYDHLWWSEKAHLRFCWQPCMKQNVQLLYSCWGGIYSKWSNCRKDIANLMVKTRQAQSNQQKACWLSSREQKGNEICCAACKTWRFWSSPYPHVHTCTNSHKMDWKSGSSTYFLCAPYSCFLKPHICFKRHKFCWWLRLNPRRTLLTLIFHTEL